MSELLAPIAFFAFNRPEHTLRALEAIRRNPEAIRTRLYAFCDGPRADETEDSRAKIEEVRSIISSEAWCAEVVTRFRDTNAGLKESLLSGISEIVEKHERVIVIEDDVVVAVGFLKFMNDLLSLYEDEPKVMHLSGYSVLEEVPTDYSETTIVLNHTLVGWGWATWRRAWERLSTDGAALRREIDRRGIKHYTNLDGAYDIYWTLYHLDRGRSQDWNAYWHASVITNDGVCISPVLSLASNIGFDGSGTQSEVASHQAKWRTARALDVKRIDLVERADFRRVMTRRPFMTKAIIRLKDFARRKLLSLG